MAQRLSFEDRRQQLQGFLTTHGRIPARGKNADEHEHSLAMWLSRMGKEATEPQRAALDQIHSDWSANRRGVPFEQNVAALRTFMDRTGTLPSTTSADPQEAHLGRFRTSMLDSNASPERRAVLDREAPGWSEPLTVTARTFGTRLGQLTKFLADHGRGPSRSAGPGPELSLHRWQSLTSVRRNADRWAAVLGAYRQAGVQPPVAKLSFEDRLAQLAAFVAEHGHAPRWAAAEGTMESLLYRWQRTRLSRSNPERMAKIVKVYADAGLPPVGQLADSA
ncbi:helicase associated domain-containing protein (plasmid) [Citricoccus nitrophenolicus]